jgi:sulfonate transport system permease protein
MFFGSTLGIAVGTRRWVSRAIEPTLLALIPIPGIAWIPLLIIFFGIGETSKILLIAISGLCTLFIPTAYGIRAADKNLVELSRVLGKSDGSLLRHVLIPSALPNMFAAMRVTLVAAWTLLISSEVIASSDGLGWLIWDARRFSKPDDMIVGMIALGILGKAGDSLLVRLEKHATRYRETYRDVPHV